jgi:hypothetical protein
VSIFHLIEAAIRHDLFGVDERQRIIDSAKNGGPEFCVCCWKTLGYPAMSTNVDDAKRWKGGAYYTDGSGQTCAECAAKEAQVQQGS